MEEQAIISRKRLEELEEIEKNYLSNTVRTIVKREVLSGYVIIDIKDVTTYNGKDSDKQLHSIIDSQMQQIETLNEIIHEKSRGFWKRIFG